MKEYERTHPWITFELNLRPLSPHAWMLLGEARSKCEHIARVPLRASTARRLHLLYLAKGVRATTAIEGNTLSEQEVKDRIEGKLQLPQSKEYLGKEVDNIVEACEELFIRATRAERIRITPELIREMNRMVLKDLELQDGVVAGELRRYSVGVGRYRGAPHQDCDHLLERLCEWLNGEAFHHDGENAIASALLSAIVAHLYIAWIHPFGDGNGRTARLLEFFILVGAGVPTPAAHLLSNFYNETRTEYYRQLDRASQVAQKGDPIGFIEYAIRGFVDELRVQLEPIWEQQNDIAWRDFVREAFEGHATPADQRRQRLLIELSRKTKAVLLADLPKLSAGIALEYANKTRKTLARDINHLEAMGLVEKAQSGGYRARKDLVFAFLPRRRRSKQAGSSATKRPG